MTEHRQGSPAANEDGSPGNIPDLEVGGSDADKVTGGASVPYEFEKHQGNHSS